MIWWALRRYWAYIALLGLLVASLVLFRNNVLLRAEVDRQVDRIDALKAKERIRDETEHSSDDDLVAGVMRRNR